MVRPNSLMVIDTVMWFREVPDWDAVEQVVRERGGVAWLETAPRGDGVSRLVKTDRPFVADLGQTVLIIRNMLPTDEFDQSVFDVPVAGAEEDTLGPYYPRLSYTSSDGFEEEFGCQAQ
jgi:hypothetical protein